jgi:hypothetical protein
MRVNTRSKTPITRGQIIKIHALKTALAIDEDLYRGILQDNFKVGSSKDLCMAEAEELIDALEGKAVELGVWERRAAQGKRYEDLAARGGMATPAQLRKIEAQWHEVSRSEEAEKRAIALRHFVARIAKVSDLRFLDSEGATKILNALKVMQREVGQRRKAGK